MFQQKAAEFVRPPTEREVLRVLWAAADDYLVRSQIHKKMPRLHRPTLGRVGQILKALHEERLLTRKVQRAQGSRKAGFYTLSGGGRELCRQMGFEYEERLLFQVDEGALRTWLTRDHLTYSSDVPGHIVSFYGYSGGLGRSTAIAHVARGLAELGHTEEVLALDLDLGAPGLDAFFAGENPGICRGLGGLLIDFERHEPRKRALWLRGAVSNSKYVLRRSDLPGVVYMPSGLSPEQNILSPSERAEALALLHTEAGLAIPAGQRDPELEPLSFLSELRKALPEKFAWTLVDPQCGRSLGGWIATQALADRLILCARVEDTSTAAIAGLRAVLASYLRKNAQLGTGGEVIFLFRLTEQWTRDRLNQWIETHLVADADTRGPSSYRAEQLVYDVRLAQPRDRWAETHFYKHLITRLDPNAATASPPPQLQALLAVLDPDKTLDDRSIAAGILENAPCKELARWVDWYRREGTLPKTTDPRGERLIDNVLRIQSRRLSTQILGPPGIQQPQLETLFTILDTDKSTHKRSMAANELKNIPCPELTHSIEGYARDGILPIETDIQGQQLIREVFLAQSEFMASKILKLATIRPAKDEG